MQKYKNTLIYYNINTYFNRFCNEKLIYYAPLPFFTPLPSQNRTRLLFAMLQHGCLPRLALYS